MLSPLPSWRLIPLFLASSPPWSLMVLNFEKTMRLTSQAQQDFGWWLHNIMLASHFLHTPPVGLTIFSDASLKGWGGTNGTSHVGGRWTDDGWIPCPHQCLGAPCSQTYLVGSCPKCITLPSAWCWTTLRLLLTLIKWGACTPTLAMRLFCLYGIGQWAETFGCLLPSSRALRTPWQIFIPGILCGVQTAFCPLLCSRGWPLCKQTELPTYPICVLETGSWGVGSECLLPLLDCSQVLCFPSLSILGRVLVKVQQDGATGMLVTPFWSTQPWFPQLLELLTDHPRLLQPKKVLLQLNGRLDMVHPLHSKMALLVTIISGQPSKLQAYQQWLQPSFVMPEEWEPNSNTTAQSFVVHRKSMLLLLL